jgi:hypothetical protein
MLGNWMLQTGGNFPEAVQHLHTAANSGKALPFVRRLQLGGLTGYDHPGSRREVMQAANAMRIHGEALDPGERRRVFGFCCDTVVTDRTELVESLSAVSEQDAWQTYLWLENAGSGDSSNPLQTLTHDYIHATLLEISGDKPEALRQYRVLQQKLRNQPNSALDVAVRAAITRLIHS